MPTTTNHFDAEALYRELLTQVRAGLADVPDAAIVGIHSGGAWLAERLAQDLGLQQRLADHQARGTPLCDQLANLLETGCVVDGLDHIERLRLAGQGIAHRDADAFDAEIESKNDVNHGSCPDDTHYA